MERGAEGRSERRRMPVVCPAFFMACWRTLSGTLMDMWLKGEVVGMVGFPCWEGVKKK